MTNNVDVSLLAECLTRSTYNTYKDLLKTHMVTEVSWHLLGDIGEYYEFEKTEPEIKEMDFKIWFRALKHPEWKIEKHMMYDDIITTLFKAKGSSTSPALQVLYDNNRIQDAIQEKIKQGNIDDAEKLIQDLRAIQKGVRNTQQGTLPIVTDLEKELQDMVVDLEG